MGHWNDVECDGPGLRPSSTTAGGNGHGYDEQCRHERSKTTECAKVIDVVLRNTTRIASCHMDHAPHSHWESRASCLPPPPLLRQLVQGSSGPLGPVGSGALWCSCHILAEVARHSHRERSQGLEVGSAAADHSHWSAWGCRRFLQTRQCDGLVLEFGVWGTCIGWLLQATPLHRHPQDRNERCYFP